MEILTQYHPLAAITSCLGTLQICFTLPSGINLIVAAIGFHSFFSRIIREPLKKEMSLHSRVTLLVLHD